MTIMLVGGGTGGHIMPLLPLAAEIKHQSNNSRIIGVLDNSNKFKKAIEDNSNFDEVYLINAGKYRRYPNQTRLESITDIKTHAKNVKDALKTVKGFAEAMSLLSRTNPDAIFLKGGYVSVPLGLAARIKKIPYIIHDSDAVVSLTGKILSKGAKYHLFGIAVPSDYSAETETKHVGVPVAESFQKVNADLKNDYKKQLGIPLYKKVVLVVGGSQGAKRMNDVMEKIVNKVIDGGTFVVHQTGKGNSTSIVKDSDYLALDYVNNMYVYSGAADVIVTRAGSSVAEFAIQEKAVIAIPAEHLAGGHQLANAHILSKNDAAIVIKETELGDNPELLYDTILDLLNNNDKRRRLASNLVKIFPSDASKNIVKLINKITNK